MPAIRKAAIGLRRAGGGVLLMLAACAAPEQAAQAPPGPIAPGQARIWFYRDYEPSVTMNDANIDLNGARALTLPAHGPAIYRDVAAGPYLIAAESAGTDINQTKTVDLRPGQEIFAKVADDPSWLAGDDVGEMHRDTYYIQLIPPQIARAQLGANR